MKNLSEVDHTDLFILPLEERKKLIEQGSEMLWRQSELTSILTKRDLYSILESSLDILDFRVEELKENEEYELCYFLSEVIWETYKRIKIEKENV